jgi:hypothetical protein
MSEWPSDIPGLSRCPFCNGIPTAYDDEMVYCVDCGAQIDYSEGPKKSASTAWNRRAGEGVKDSEVTGYEYQSLYSDVRHYSVLLKDLRLTVNDILAREGQVLDLINHLQERVGALEKRTEDMPLISDYDKA